MMKGFDGVVSEDGQLSDPVPRGTGSVGDGVGEGSESTDILEPGRQLLQEMHILVVPLGLHCVKLDQDAPRCHHDAPQRPHARAHAHAHTHTHTHTLAPCERPKMILGPALAYTIAY